MIISHLHTSYGATTSRLFFFMDNILKIYKSAKWQKTRLAQLERDHNECQRCKHNGKYKDVKGTRKYTKAVLVHHDFRLKQYPQYAFTSVVNGTRNLYSLCQSCHKQG